MIIKVTEDCIRMASRYNCERCPVAIAIREALWRMWETYRPLTIRVAPREVCISWQIVRLPIEVFRFIIEFDAGNPVEPFEFELDYE